VNTYHAGAWDVAYGSSGTIGAVGDVLAAGGWPAGVVSQAGLDWLLDRLVKAQSADRLKIDGMKEDRRAVIGGGVSVLRAVFDLLGIEQMQGALGALRHGVLYDMLNREQGETDLRSTSVARLAARFDVDTAQAERVSKVARQLFLMVTSRLNMTDAERRLRKLQWAAQLHEIGSQISHSDYHKHGAYILDNADAPGFAQPELHRLSLLVLGHRGKLRKLEVDFDDSAFMMQLLCLRIAVILCHARGEPDVKGLQLSASAATDKSIALTCRPGWPDAFPQSSHLLREEVLAWQKTPWAFTFASS
jgi:exopolyphosphatase / guanosine-5'-triphosphate,3'-diphosphate pyrophosphatase